MVEHCKIRYELKINLMLRGFRRSDNPTALIHSVSMRDECLTDLGVHITIYFRRGRMVAILEDFVLVLIRAKCGLIVILLPLSKVHPISFSRPNAMTSGCRSEQHQV